MPDIFDEIDKVEAKPAGDVFDEISPEIPKPQPWELSPTGQKPYLGQFSGGLGSPYEELNREEALNIFKSMAEPPIAAPRFEGETTAGKIAAGVGNVAGGIYNMLASPVGLATLPLAGTKIGTPIVKGVFGGLAAKTAGEQLGEASVTGDVQQYTEGLLNALMAPGIALPGKFGYVEPEKVRMAKDLAREIGRAEPTIEPTTPEAIRQLGVRVPDVTPFADPEVARLADAALQERMRLVQVPGQEQNALMDLRRALEPPRVEIAKPVARAERIQGGGEAPYGKVSFMREAESPLPERTQAALAEPAPKPAEPASVEAAVPVPETAKAEEVQPPLPPSPEAQAKPKRNQVGKVFDRLVQNNRSDLEGLLYNWDSVELSEDGSRLFTREMRGTGEKIRHNKGEFFDWLFSDEPFDANKYAQDPEWIAQIQDFRRLASGETKPAPATEAKPAAAPTEAKTEVKAKQPWEMTSDEVLQLALANKPPQGWQITRKVFVDTNKKFAAANGAKPASDQQLKRAHEREVEWSLSQGKPVPAEVLADYPDLAPKQPPPQPSAGIEKQGKEGKIAEPNEITSSEKQIVDVGVPERVPPIITTPAETKTWLSGIKAAYGRGTDEARRAIDGLKTFAKSRKYWDSSSRAVGNIARSLGVDISHRTSDTSRIQLGANVIRLANQESLFHEVGHAILLQKSGGVPWEKMGDVRGEWKALHDADWAGVARDKWDYWTTQTERYASLLNLYVKHNAKFQKLAPELYLKLERLLDESVPTIALFQEARKRGVSPQVLLNEKLSQLRKTQTPSPVAQTVGETQPPQTKGIITGRAIEKWADDTLSGGATHLGPDVLAAYLVKGAALIERGIINFAEWSARMIAEHGDKVKPHLRELFAAAQETVKRAPVSESGTLKSAREIVESKLAQPEATPKTTTLAPALTGTTLDDVYRIFEPVPKESTPIKQKGINSIEAVRTGFSSKFRPTNELAEQIAKSYGGTRKDIAGIFEQLKGSSGKGEAEIYRFDRDVSSLVKGQEQDFNAYMFLRRSLDRLRQDLADIQTAQAGGEVKKLNRRAVAKYTIPQLESKLSLLQQNLGPEGLQRFEQAAQRYQEYMDRALRLQVESGRMSQDLYQAIKDGNQFYAPFKVMKYLQEGMKPEGTGRKIDTVADYTKAMEGIEDPNFKLGDMLSAARQNLLISRILADKAVAMRNIADLAAIDTEGKFVRRLGKGQDIPEGTAAVNVFENGEKVRYAVPPHVAEALQIYGQTGGGIISRFLEGASIPFKVGATMLNIPFQFSNLMADVPRTALVSKYGVRGVTDLVRYPLDLVESIFSTMYSVVGKRPTKLYLDFLDSGAAGSAIQEYLTPKALAYRDPATMSKAKRIALNILYTPAEFAKAIEQTSKVLGVKRAIRLEGVKSGAELSKQTPDAITEIRRFSGSPDFGRQGKWTEQARLNLLYMFLNARIQGAVADVGRLTGRDGAKPALTSWIRLGIGVGVPTAYLYYLNNSPEYKADYDSRSQKEKDNYWLIPKDSFITNEQGERMRDFWKIPKRESSKWIGNMVESAMNFAQKQDPKAFAQFGQQMIEDISPVNIQGDTAQERLESIGSSLNPLIKAPLELATGRDLYRHRQLVPDTMQKASPEQQYTDRTSQAFITLAKAMPDVAPDVLRSPIMLENVTRNLTAGLITQFLPRKPVEGRGAIENIPLLQRFQAIPYLDNEAFRKEMEALERESADEYLMRHRTALEAIDKNKNQSLPVILKNTGFTDLKLIRHIVDLWVADQNGATSQDRRLIALPAKQRAEYVAKMLKPMTPEQKQKTILDLAKKRVLTEAVFQEMSQLPQ